MKASVCECDSVCEPVGSLPVVCSWRYSYGETETSSGAPVPLLWWKAALIEWPGTQPPFLIITAVQSLLITLKVCRAPRSPVMLQAIRESGRKIRHFWQNPLSKQLKKGGNGADVKAVQQPSSFDSFLYLVHDEVETLFTIKNAECTPFFYFWSCFQDVNGCQTLFFLLLLLQRLLFVVVREICL